MRRPHEKRCRTGNQGDEEEKEDDRVIISRDTLPSLGPGPTDKEEDNRAAREEKGPAEKEENGPIEDEKEQSAEKTEECSAEKG
jgi:hypothetical protein